MSKAKADEYQIGGKHYRTVPGEQHWTRVHRLGQDYFQGCITKYVERWRQKGGIQDLEKARHFLEKYIELEKAKLPEEPDEPGYIKPGETMTEFWQRGIGKDPRLGAGYEDPYKKVADRINKQREIDVTQLSSTAKDILKESRKDTYYFGEVMATGWMQFVFEGAQSEGELYTCRECGEHFNAPPYENPHRYHACHKIASDNGPVRTDGQTGNDGPGPCPTGKDGFECKDAGVEPQPHGYVDQNGKS